MTIAVSPRTPRLAGRDGVPDRRAAAAAGRRRRRLRPARRPRLRDLARRADSARSGCWCCGRWPWSSRQRRCSPPSPRSRCRGSTGRSRRGCCPRSALTLAALGLATSFGPVAVGRAGRRDLGLHRARRLAGVGRSAERVRRRRPARLPGRRPGRPRRRARRDAIASTSGVTNDRLQSPSTGLTKAYGRKLAARRRHAGHSAAASPACSAPTAPARRRCCGCWPRSCARAAASCGCSAATRATRAERTAIRRRLGYLPQDPGFHQHFTAFEFVDYIATLKEWTDRDARHARSAGCCARSASTTSRTGASARSRAACAGASRSRRRCSATPSCWCSTSRPSELDPQQRLHFRELISEAAEAVRGRALDAPDRGRRRAVLARRRAARRRGRLRRHAGRARRARRRPRVDLRRPACPGATVAWRTGDGRTATSATRPPARGSSSRRSRTAT